MRILSASWLARFTRSFGDRLPECTRLRTRSEHEHGENLLLIGEQAVKDHAELLARTGDPVTVGDGSFTVGGVTYDQSSQAVMHTMIYPGRPGRFITAFVSNGEVGWAKLRLIVHYRRDTTVVWKDGEVIQRRTFEPDRKVYITVE